MRGDADVVGYGLRSSSHGKKSVAWDARVWAQSSAGGIVGFQWEEVAWHRSFL